jgi:hypothetical protein
MTKHDEEIYEFIRDKMRIIEMEEHSLLYESSHNLEHAKKKVDELKADMVRCIKLLG